MHRAISKACSQAWELPVALTRVVIKKLSGLCLTNITAELVLGAATVAMVVIATDMLVDA